MKWKDVSWIFRWCRGRCNRIVSCRTSSCRTTTSIHSKTPFVPIIFTSTIFRIDCPNTWVTNFLCRIHWTFWMMDTPIYIHRFTCRIWWRCNGGRQRRVSRWAVWVWFSGWSRMVIRRWVCWRRSREFEWIKSLRGTLDNDWDQQINKHFEVL